MRRRAATGAIGNEHLGGRLATAIVALSVPLVVCACASGAGKRQTSALLEAVEGYRHAGPSAKAARAHAIGDVECSEAGVCEARGICASAAQATAEALHLKDDVAARLADIEQKRMPPDAPEAAALPGKLDDAQRLLETGRQSMSECERRISDLRARYGS